MSEYNCAIGNHRMRFITHRDLIMGRDLSAEAVDDKPQKIDCQQPNKLVCDICFFQYLKKCGALKDDKCLPCSLRAKADKKLAVRSGLERSPMGWVEITLTAGGADVLPWDLTKCNHNADMKHSGKKGCRVNEIDGAITNAYMPKDFNRFVQSVRRMFGKQVQYVKIFEAQERDVLHIHGIFTGVPPMKLPRLKKEMRRLAKRHGFGGEVSVKRVYGDSPNDRNRAVNYVAKYLTKGSKTLRTLHLRTGELRLGGYRDFTASRKYGDTLKEIRRLRYAYFVNAKDVEQSRIADSANGANANATGDEVALDDYKKSYTFIE